MVNGIIVELATPLLPTHRNNESVQIDLSQPSVLFPDNLGIEVSKS
jgi:hypothetical protein